MSPKAVEATCDVLVKSLEKLTLKGHRPLVLVSPQIRAGLRMMTESHLPRLVVLSYNEVTRDTQIESVAMVSDVKS
jgi:flagellar biosynthesis protein FlhA